MWQCLLLILLLSQVTEEASVKLTCGTSSDITNINSGILPDSTGLTNKFESLDISCFGKQLLFAFTSKHFETRRYTLFCKKLRLWTSTESVLKLSDFDYVAFLTRFFNVP